MNNANLKPFVIIDDDTGAFVKCALIKAVVPVFYGSLVNGSIIKMCDDSEIRSSLSPKSIYNRMFQIEK